MALPSISEKFGFAMVDHPTRNKNKNKIMYVNAKMYHDGGDERAGEDMMVNF